MPANKSKTPPKSKKPAPKKGTSKAAPSKPKKSQKPAPPPPAPERAPSFWENLSIDRRLDIIGIGLALVGLLTLLSVASARRSALTGGLVRFLGQIFGWGVYILPVGLIVIGLWLVLRNLESVPAFSVERVVGVVILFFWLLTLMHAIIAVPEMAEQAALDGVGGG